MNKPRILKALLWIIQEQGGLLNEIDGYLGELYKAGYIDIEHRKKDGDLLPYWVLTDKGREKV